MFNVLEQNLQTSTIKASQNYSEGETQLKIRIVYKL